ncbi:MAG TPA: DUF72 domain-containing protein [Flavobacterium sp.]|jgi:uncharacterized protein YecE (DUF72 family)
MKNQHIHIGCSSFYNTYWKTIFYPEELPRKEWFHYYCQHFSTYELNATFYRFPTLKSLQNWYNKTPDDFIFSVKAPKQITHLKKFVECSQEIKDFYEICQEGFREKLGCILFQLPPSFNYSEERLSLIVDSMNPGFKNVIEFRNETWWDQNVYNILSENNITFCNVNYPKLPATILQTTALGYIRLHGNPQLFYSEYTHQELEVYKQQIQAMGCDTVFIYFNNTASTAGIINALDFKELLIN